MLYRKVIAINVKMTELKEILLYVLITNKILKELDLVAASLSVTYPRSQIVAFSLQFDDDQISLLIPYPSQHSTLDGITRPFRAEAII